MFLARFAAKANMLPANCIFKLSLALATILLCEVAIATDIGCGTILRSGSSGNDISIAANLDSNVLTVQLTSIPSLQHNLLNYKLQLLETVVVQLGGDYTKSDLTVKASFDRPLKTALSRWTSLNQLLINLTENIPDPGAIEMSDNVERFRGNVHELIRGNFFRNMVYPNGQPISLPYPQALVDATTKFGAMSRNRNWSLVSRVNARNSKDSLSQRFPRDQTFREFYWRLTNGDDQYYRPVLQPNVIRIATNSRKQIGVDGDFKEVDLEVFVSDSRVSSKPVWRVMRYIKKDREWERTSVDHLGNPLVLGCIKCHGVGKDFGPTPKNLREGDPRPEGWLVYDVDVPNVSPTGAITYLRKRTASDALINFVENLPESIWSKPTHEEVLRKVKELTPEFENDHLTPYFVK